MGVMKCNVRINYLRNHFIVTTCKRIIYKRLFSTKSRDSYVNQEIYGLGSLGRAISIYEYNHGLDVLAWLTATAAAAAAAAALALFSASDILRNSS